MDGRGGRKNCGGVRTFFMKNALARRDLTIAALVLLFAIQAVIRFDSHLNHVVAWHLHVGGRLLDGATLYVDIVDLSSPYVLWMSMPVVALARLLGVNVVYVFQALVLALAAVSVAMSGRFLAAITDFSPGARHLFLILLAGLMLYLPGSDFGQRDHIGIVLVTPWILLRWNRLLDREAPWILAAAVGLMAGIGAWMAPIFLVVVVVFEITVLFVARSVGATLRIETLAILAVSAVFGMAVWLSALKKMSYVTLIGFRAYSPIYVADVDDFLIRLLLPGALVAIAIISASLMTPRSQLLRVLLIVAGTGFIFAFFAQFGTRSELIPSLFFLTLAGGLGIVRIGAGDVDYRSPRQRFAAIGGANATLVALAVLVSVWSASPTTYQGEKFERAIAAEAPEARSIFIASAEASQAFPLVEENGLIWASRFPSQWFAPHTSTKLNEEGGPNDDIGEYALLATLKDFTTFVPDIVFINENPVRPYFVGPPLDYLHFWGSEIKFRIFWRQYEKRGVVDGFGVYVHKDIAAAQ